MTGSMRRWRWWVAGGAAIVVAAVSVLLLSGSDSGSDAEHPAVSVVRAYLEALLSGDADTAAAIAGPVPLADRPGAPDVSTALLTEAALRPDWTVSELSFREAPHSDGGAGTVITTVIAADGTAGSGRFRVERDLSGDWRIRNPYVPVSNLGMPFAGTGFNGEVTDESLLWLFPGAYAINERVAPLATAEEPTFIALPQSSTPGLARRLGTGYTPTEGAGAILQAATAELFTACGGADPFACPLTVDEIGLPSGDRLHLADVETTVRTLPTLRLGFDDGGSFAETIHPGLAELSATGYRDDGGEGEPVTVVCDIEVGASRLQIGEDGSVTFPPTGRVNVACVPA